MRTRTKNVKLFVMVLADSTLLGAALIGACLLRFDLALAGEHVRHMLVLAPVIVPAQVALFALFGLYRHLWRRTGRLDLWRLALACLISMLFALACATLLRWNLSWSLLIIDAILGFLMASTLRVGIRTLCEARTPPEDLKTDRPGERNIPTCPLCGRESNRVDRPPPELTVSCIYSIH